MNNFLIKLNLALLTFIISFGLTSCALSFEYHLEDVDPNLAVYVNDYKALLKEHCPKFEPTRRYSIAISDKLDGPLWVGVCYHKINGYRIRIDKGYWELSNKNEREQLMFHELAHCIIDRGHEDNLPGHYMYPEMNDIKREVYMDQVITDIKNFCETIK